MKAKDEIFFCPLGYCPYNIEGRCTFWIERDYCSYNPILKRKKRKKEK